SLSRKTPPPRRDRMSETSSASPVWRLKGAGREPTIAEAPALHDLLVEALNGADGPVPAERRVDPDTIRAATRGATLRRREEDAECLHELTHGVGRADDAPGAVADQLRQGPLAGNDHREPGGHRLGHRETEALQRRRRHEHVGQVVDARLLLLGHAT